MQEYIDGLVEARQKAWHQAKEMVARATDEKRELDAEERASVDRAFDDIDRLDADIKSMTARVQSDRENDVVREAYGEIVRPTVKSARVDEMDAFLRGQGPRHMDIDLRAAANEKRLIRNGFSGQELRDLTTTVAASGGNAVPTSFARQLYNILEVFSGTRNTNATIITTTGGEALEFPRVTAGGTAAFLGEGSALAEADPGFGKMTMNAFKYGQLIQVSNELLSDTGVDIVSFIAGDLGKALGRVTDAAYVLGSGSGAPQGIMTAAGTGITGGTGVAGVPTVANLVDMVYSVNREYRANNAQWFMRDSTAGAIRKLAMTTGELFWQPSVQAGEPDQLLGFPVITDPNVAATGTSANSVAFGDFSAFYIRDVGSVRIERSDDFAFANDLVTWRAVLRTDSDLIDPAAIRIYRGGSA